MIFLNHRFQIRRGIQVEMLAAIGQIPAGQLPGRDGVKTDGVIDVDGDFAISLQKTKQPGVFQIAVCRAGDGASSPQRLEIAVFGQCLNGA